jgi:hypothetical protein
VKIDHQAYRLAAIVLVAATITGLGAAWALGGDADVTVGGAAAFGIGGFATVLLGGALATALFYSDRSGLDR